MGPEQRRGALVGWCTVARIVSVNEEAAAVLQAACVQEGCGAAEPVDKPEGAAKFARTSGSGVSD